jgi:hypothetical protein
MNYFKKTSIGLLASLSMTAALSSKAQDQLPDQSDLQKMDMAFRKQALALVRSPLNIQPIATPVLPKDAARLFNKDNSVEIDFATMRRPPYECTSTVPNLVNITQILAEAKNKPYLLYTNQHQQKILLHTKQLQELYTDSHQETTHIYLELNDEDVAYYMTNKGKIENCMPINFKALRISTGFLERYDMQICQDALRHEKHHGNGNNISETSDYIADHTIMAWQRHSEFRADSLAMRERYSQSPTPLDPEKQGLPRLFAADLQNMQKNLNKKLGEYHTQKKQLNANLTLKKLPTEITLAAQRKEIDSLSAQFRIQQGFMCDPEYSHYTRIQRVYYQLVLGTLFNEEKRNGKNSPLIGMLNQLLPHPSYDKSGDKTAQAPAFICP